MKKMCFKKSFQSMAYDFQVSQMGGTSFIGNNLTKI